MFWFELSSDPYRQTAKQPCSSKLGSSNASGQVNILNLAQSLIDTETVTVPKYFSSVPDNSLGYIIPWLVGLSGHDPNVDHENMIIMMRCKNDGISKILRFSVLIYSHFASKSILKSQWQGKNIQHCIKMRYLVETLKTTLWKEKHEIVGITH